MSVTTCVEIGRGKRRGRLTDTFQREYSRFWRARTNTYSDDAYLVITDAINKGLLPDIASEHPNDTEVLLKEFNITEQQDTDTQCWIIEGRYSTNTADPSLQNIDPINEPAVINFDTERVAQAWTTDLDDKAFVNSTGDPYDPPEMVEDGILVAQYQDNIALGVGSQINDYLYSANETTFMGQNPKTVLISRFTLRRLFRNNILYYQRNVEFKVDPATDWTIRELVDQGYRVVSNNVPIGAGTGGSMPSKPVLLNGHGGKLSPSDIAAGTVFLSAYRIRNTADFNVIIPPFQTINF
jgi:hypothetical protein